MSAIAKPFISSSTAINLTELVPVEKIISMDKQDIVDPNDTTKNQYLIICVVDGEVAPREIKLKYTSAAIRNTAFANIKAAICTAI